MNFGPEIEGIRGEIGDLGSKSGLFRSERGFDVFFLIKTGFFASFLVSKPSKECILLLFLSAI